MPRPSGSRNRPKLPTDDKLKPSEQIVYELLRDPKYALLAESFVLEALRTFSAHVDSASAREAAQVMGPLLWNQWTSLATVVRSRVEALYMAQLKPTPKQPPPEAPAAPAPTTEPHIWPWQLEPPAHPIGTLSRRQTTEEDDDGKN